MASDSRQRWPYRAHYQRPPQVPAWRSRTTRQPSVFGAIVGRGLGCGPPGRRTPVARATAPLSVAPRSMRRAAADKGAR